MLVSEFPVIVKKMDDNYLIFCEHFNIVVENKSLDKAYVELEALRKKSIAHLEKFGIPLPSSKFKNVSNHNRPIQIQNDGSQASYVKFFIAILILGGCIVGIFAPIIGTANNLLKPFTGGCVNTNMKSLSSSSSITTPAFWSSALSKVAQTLKQVTPERKQEIKENLNVIVSEMLPFVNELRPLLSDKLNIENIDVQTSTQKDDSQPKIIPENQL